MGPAAVAEDMEEKPGVGQQVREGRAVHAEELCRQPAAGGLAQHQGQQGQQGEIQHHRGVVLHLVKQFHGRSFQKGNGDKSLLLYLCRRPLATEKTILQNVQKFYGTF